MKKLILTLLVFAMTISTAISKELSSTISKSEISIQEVNHQLAKLNKKRMLTINALRLNMTQKQEALKIYQEENEHQAILAVHLEKEINIYNEMKVSKVSLSKKISQKKVIKKHKKLLSESEKQSDKKFKKLLTHKQKTKYKKVKKDLRRI